MAIFVMLILFTGFIGAFAFSRLRSENPFIPQTVQSAPLYAGRCASGQEQAVSEARKLALDYYAKKYNDTDVSIDVRSLGDHMEADIRKRGLLAKKLFIQGDKVTEEKTGIRNWVFDLFTNAN